MHLDVPTLIFAGSFVSLIGAAVLVGAWLTMGRPASLLWGAAFALGFSIGAGCIGAGVTEGWFLATFAGGFVSTASMAFVWAGVVAFRRKQVHPAPVFLAIMVWALADILLVAVGQPQAAMISGFAIAIALLCAVEYELWRGRNEPLVARWPFMAIVALHILILTGGIYDTLVSASLVAGSAPALDSWFGIIHFEALVFIIGAAVLMVTMCRERITHDFQRTSQLDPLTGIANRRALFTGAERALERCQASSTPFSVIAFDLDDFKAINDAHGHAIGDAVLTAFVTSTRSVLRPTDFFGRHGGEEFAIILPGTTLTAAYAIAERARHAFADAGRSVEARQVFATVSAGVAEARPGQTFDGVLDAADRALYRAKHHGRNRVERAEATPAADHEPVARIA